MPTEKIQKPKVVELNQRRESQVGELDIFGDLDSKESGTFDLMDLNADIDNN